MDLATLRSAPGPSELATDHLRALWYDLNGDWDTAHRIVQQMDDRHAMWIHAYLHRKEPDLANARYWYRQANKPFPGEMSDEAEVAEILADLMVL